MGFSGIWSILYPATIKMTIPVIIIMDRMFCRWMIHLKQSVVRDDQITWIFRAERKMSWNCTYGSDLLSVFAIYSF